QTVIADAIRRCAPRYASDSFIEAGEPKDVGAALEHGVTAFICGSRPLAVQTREQLERLGAQIPSQISVAAVGTGWGDYSCSGYYVHAAQKAEAIIQLLRDNNAHRPVTMWLAGQFVDAGTIGSRCAEASMSHLAIAPQLSGVSA